MNEPFQLVTNCTFKGKDYLVQMCVLNSKKLELIITDKLMAEDWQCEYDASYIESLTHKTGNFKQFDVFVTMLKSGLLKTSDCITLDLLTVDDLEQLRCKKMLNSHPSSRASQSGRLNKRYLILTYSVEFDRIHYPLPLEYCGPPDPSVLQRNIRRLESEIERLKQKNAFLSQGEVSDTKKLKEKIENLTEDNTFLKSEVYRLNKLLTKKNKPLRNTQALQNSLKKLEEQVQQEKNHNRQLVVNLRAENKQLKLQIEELKKSEKCLNMKLKEAFKNGAQRGCRRPVRTYLSPDNSLDRRRSTRSLEKPLTGVQVSGWNNSTSNKPRGTKPTKRRQNRYISTSSSESGGGGESSHRARSRERDQLSVPKNELRLKNSGTSRKSSNERNRHSSEDSKGKMHVQRSKYLTEAKRSSSQEGKSRISNPLALEQSQPEACSRDSSLSSRGSSKHSKLSRFSNLGSGDCRAVKSKRTSRSTLENREDIKFSMSDLETRIHALQKLLSEGINF